MRILLVFLMGFSFCSFAGAAAEQSSLDFLDTHGGKWVKERNCVSCHSAFSYGLGRIGTLNWERSEVMDLESYLDSRQSNWDSAKPWYGTRESAKGLESIGTEAILEAFLSSQLDDARGIKFSERTRLALSRMFFRQQGDGSFPWLDFGLQPLESTNAKVFGASLAKIVLARAELDQSFEEENKKLITYLRSAHNSASVFLYYKVAILWAASFSSDLLTPEEVRTTLSELFQTQNSDGGWSLNKLGAWQKKGNSLWAGAEASDANATALISLALKFIKTDLPGFQNKLTKAKQWLVNNRQNDGSWPGVSVNKDANRNHEFMQDLATGMAVKALE